jgi:hypothetical protein
MGGVKAEMREFTQDNTSGFTDHELDEMNTMLSNMMMSDELDGIDDNEREKEFSKQILDHF